MPASVADRDSGKTHVVQRMRPDRVESELVGHRERLATEADRFLVLARERRERGRRS